MATKSESYSTMKSRLEELLARLQDPTTDIEEATKLYEEGIQIIGSMEKYLQTAENKIRQVRHSAPTKQ